MGLKTRRYLEIGELADMGHSSAAPLQRLGLWSGKTLGGAGFGFGGFLLAIFRRSGGFERTEELQGNGGDLIDGVLESGFVGFGGLVKAGDFAHELERGSADFVGSDRRIKVVKGFDVAAHGCSWFVEDLLYGRPEELCRDATVEILRRMKRSSG